MHISDNLNPPSPWHSAIMKIFFLYRYLKKRHTNNIKFIMCFVQWHCRNLDTLRLHKSRYIDKLTESDGNIVKIPVKRDFNIINFTFRLTNDYHTHCYISKNKCNIRSYMFCSYYLTKLAPGALCCDHNDAVKRKLIAIFCFGSNKF